MKRSAPPKRKTPLKRKSTPKRKTRPKLRSVSEREWERWRQHERLLVRERSRGICEAPVPDQLHRCTTESEHVHHPFGRHEEPWSSWHVITLDVCFAHHEEVTGRVGTGLNKPLRVAMRAMAARRMAAVLGGVTGLKTDEDYAIWAEMFLTNAKIYHLAPDHYEAFVKQTI